MTAPTPDNPPPSSATGRLLSGRYDILEPLGSGAFSTVYRASDRRSGMPVAVKFLNTEYLNESYRLRLVREVQLLRQLRHPNIVRFVDFGRDDCCLYIVTEFVEGVGLDEAGIAVEGVERMLEELLGGLAAIHAAGAVHRDVKPANIMVRPTGEMVILDMGAARLRHSQLTQSGTIIGTPPYIAPEIWSGLPAAPASDFYALGVLVYEVLTGRLPFEADNPVAFKTLHTTISPRPPSEYRPEIPYWLDRIVLTLLAKRPELRSYVVDKLLDCDAPAAVL